MSTQAVNRLHSVTVEIERGEELLITPLSDLHIESSAFDLDGFQSLMAERGEHPHHRVILIGDAMDLVVPVDLKRWRASVQDKSIVGRDDWLNASIELAVKRLKIPGATYDLCGIGNHEDEFRKRHGFDVTSVLAHELGCARGGYSGVIEYDIRYKGTKGAVGPRFRIAYHHGAWGGRLVKGFGGARDWFRGFDGWNVAVYGHNHQTTVHRESRMAPSRNGQLKEYPVYYVNTSAWVESYSKDASITHYSERAGYMPTSRRTPAIRVRPSNQHVAGKGKRNVLDYTVEV